MGVSWVPRSLKQTLFSLGEGCGVTEDSWALTKPSLHHNWLNHSCWLSHILIIHHSKYSIAADATVVAPPLDLEVAVLTPVLAPAAEEGLGFRVD